VPTDVSFCCSVCLVSLKTFYLRLRGRTTLRSPTSASLSASTPTEPCAFYSQRSTTARRKFSPSRRYHTRPTCGHWAFSLPYCEFDSRNVNLTHLTLRRSVSVFHLNCFFSSYLGPLVQYWDFCVQILGFMKR